MNADDISFEEIGEQRYRLDDEEDDDLFTSSSVTTSTSTSITNLPTMPGASTVGSIGAGNGVSVGTSYSFSTTQKPTLVHTFDLMDLGIQQVGTFDSSGMMSGWVVNNFHSVPPQYPAFMQGQHTISLYSGPDYHVYIRGVYSKYFTNERRKAMGLQPL